MLLAHWLFWPTAGLGRAALQCPQFGLVFCILAERVSVHASRCWCAWRVHFGRAIFPGAPPARVGFAPRLSPPARLHLHTRIPVTASTVFRRAHLRGQSACILPPLQQLLIAARLGCQPRRLHRARRVSNKHPACQCRRPQQPPQPPLPHPSTQTRGHEPRLPAPTRDGAPRRAQPAPERAAGQHQDRVRDRVAAQRRL